MNYQLGLFFKSLVKFEISTPSSPIGYKKRTSAISKIFLNFYFFFLPPLVIISMNVALEHQYMDSGFGKSYLWYDWHGGLAAAKEQ